MYNVYESKKTPLTHFLRKIYKKKKTIRIKNNVFISIVFLFSLHIHLPKLFQFTHPFVFSYFLIFLYFLYMVLNCYIYMPPHHYYVYYILTYLCFFFLYKPSNTHWQFLYINSKIEDKSSRYFFSL